MLQQGSKARQGTPYPGERVLLGSTTTRQRRLLPVQMLERRVLLQSLGQHRHPTAGNILESTCSRICRICRIAVVWHNGQTLECGVGQDRVRQLLRDLEIGKIMAVGDDDLAISQNQSPDRAI